MPRKPAKYQLLTDSVTNQDVKKGAIVYECTKHDYGSASDDTRITGRKHISLTLKSNGDYPFFTHEEAALKEVE